MTLHEHACIWPAVPVDTSIWESCANASGECACPWKITPSNVLYGLVHCVNQNIAHYDHIHLISWATKLTECAISYLEISDIFFTPSRYLALHILQYTFFVHAGWERLSVDSTQLKRLAWTRLISLSIWECC